METGIAMMKWDNENEYWVCSCGAIYRRPKNWNPSISWCMKCKGVWV